MNFKETGALLDKTKDQFWDLLRIKFGQYFDDDKKLFDELKEYNWGKLDIE
jgi:hypothetical protein